MCVRRNFDLLFGKLSRMVDAIEKLNLIISESDPPYRKEVGNPDTTEFRIFLKKEVLTIVSFEIQLML